MELSSIGASLSLLAAKASLRASRRSCRLSERRIGLGLVVFAGRGPLVLDRHFLHLDILNITQRY